MTLHEVMTSLEQMGSEQSRKIYKNHGAKDPLFGVKIGDMKKLVKKIKRDHELGLELYATGNYDAKYLAHYIVNPKKMTKSDLDLWLEGANSYMLSEYAVSNVAAESPDVLECIRDWMGRDEKYARTAAFATYSNYISITPNEQLNYEEIRSLMENIKDNIHDETNRVRYVMNNFIICVGSYIPELSDIALDIAAEIGKVKVYMGKTSCKVPNAVESINKIKDMDRLGKKRKTTIC